MHLPRTVRAVVFDMDGLLVDTEAVYRDVMTVVAAERGHEMPFNLFRSMIGLTGPMSDRRMLNHFGEDYPVEAFNTDVRARVEAACEVGVALKAGVTELLDDLDAAGLPRAIATSSSPRGVQTHLGGSGILPRFNAVIARGDYVHGKPSPDPFLVAAQALRIPAGDCLALEDSHNGVRAAAAAGMMTVMVPDLLEPSDEMRSLCVHIARNLHEVREMLAAQWADQRAEGPRSK